MAMHANKMKKKGMARGGMKKKGMARGGMKKKGYSKGGVGSSDPAWLKAMKKEADKLGIPLRELLTRSMKKDKPAPKKAAAKKGGMMKKKGMARGGVSKRRTRK